ncbi:MAG: ferritin family protein [Dehalococcoidia bacterium]
MAGFTNPFPGIPTARNISQDELIRAIRLDLAAEQDATHTYMAHAAATDNVVARKILTSIANEERVHAGEFLQLLILLDPDEARFVSAGMKEARKEAGLTNEEEGELVRCMECEIRERGGVV